MNCNEAGELMVDSPGEPAGAKSREFAAHLETCTSCSEMASISDARRQIMKSYSDPIVTVPPFFSARVMAAIAERRAVPDGWGWIWRMAKLTVPAMVGMVVLAAVFTFGYSPAVNGRAAVADNQF